MDYRRATAVEEIAAELIEEFHPHLKDTRIVYAYTEKASRRNGKTVLGKASVESGKSVWLASGGGSEYQYGKFFLVAIAENEWRFLDDAQQRALVDHELCHLGKDVETGEICIWPHDIEEFGAVVRRHGMWLKDIEEFIEAANQQDLPFDGPVPLRFATS